MQDATALFNARRSVIPLLLLAALVRPAAADTPSPPGVVVDHVAAATKRYVGSPSLAVLPDGTYVATHDYFGPGSESDRTVVFASTDRGRRWERRAAVDGQFWSSVFVHDDALYLFGTSEQYGDVVIRRSTDGGRSWTRPEDEDSGRLLTRGHYHTAPVPVVLHDGHLWRAMEDAMGPNGWGSHFRAFVMSAPVGSDLLDADSWTVTDRLKRDGSWLHGAFRGWLEGNAVVTPGGRLVNILRAAYPDGGKAAVVRVGSDGKAAEFDPDRGFVDFPGGAKKFTIRPDPRGDRYWSLTNYVPPKHEDRRAGSTRNTVALVRSSDLREWTVQSILLYHPDPEKHGFQYLDWHFDGDDIIAVARTAYDDAQGGAHSAHDANYLTFHRFEAFRDRTMEDSPVDPKALGIGGSPDTR